MKLTKLFLSALLLPLAGLTAGFAAQPTYNIYMGGTHAHSNYSGDIVKKARDSGRQLDPANTVGELLKSAKQAGYDFYAITDHSQYEVYDRAAWKDVHDRAREYTDENFVAIPGFEFSRNENTDGKGHINVYYTPDFVSAADMGMEQFQNWLVLPENKNALACFNHPEKFAYKNFQCYNKKAQEKISMIELINGANAKFYENFLLALSKGWRVSPVAGGDNHQAQGVKQWKARTGVAARELTPEALMEAFAARRTYATFDKDLRAIYYVNGQPMGSVIKPGKGELKFDIDLSTDKNTISKVEIVGGGGKIVEEKEFSSNEVKWQVEVPRGEPYYFLMIYQKGLEGPAAWMAPVWIE